MYTIVLVIATLMQAGDRAVADDPVALTDGRRAMAGNLAGIRVDAKRVIGSVMTPAELAQIAADAVPVGELTQYPGGVAEVHLALERAVLERCVAGILAERRVKSDEVGAITKAIKSPDVEPLLTVAGFSQPANDRPAGRNASPTERDARPTVGRMPLLSVEDLLAESARLDARRKVASEAGQIRLSGGGRCAALFAVRPDVEAALLREIPGAALSGPRFTAGDACEVDAAIDAGALLEIMRRQLSLERPAGDDDWDPRRLTPAKDANGRISVVGRGVRPSRAVERGAGLAWSWPAPAWANQAITVTGTAAVGGGASFAQAVSDAEFDARRQIAEQVDALPCTDGRTVRQVLAAGGVSPQGMEIWLNGAHRLGPPASDAPERVAVTLRIPLRGLYRLLSQATLTGTERWP